MVVKWESENLRSMQKQRGNGCSQCHLAVTLRTTWTRGHVTRLLPPFVRCVLIHSIREIFFPTFRRVAFALISAAVTEPHNEGLGKKENRSCKGVNNFPRSLHNWSDITDYTQDKDPNYSREVSFFLTLGKTPQRVEQDMFALTVVLLLSSASTRAAGSARIIFPTSFPAPEQPHDDLHVKACYQKGIDAVQNVAGLMQSLLLQETINFAAKNWIISPVSLAGVFAQLLMGSRGEIRQILTKILSLVDDEEDYTKLEVHRQLGNLLRYLHHPHGDDYLLLLNGVVFLQAGFPFKATYRHALMDFYDTKIIPVDFSGKSSESLKTIGDWVRNSTLGRFSDVLLSPLPPSTVSLMANVVYFKGAWEMPFDPEYTQPGPFFIDQTRKVHVDYMYGEQEILYGNTSDFQLVGLPFKSRKVVIYILLPNGKFSTRMAMKHLDATASSARLHNVTLVLPKFKVTTTFSVKNAIAKYITKGPPPPTPHWPSPNRLPDQPRFRHAPRPSPPPSPTPPPTLPQTPPQDHFDMTGASDDLRFRIDDIIQKVSLHLDERGTEIAAVTSTLVDHSASDFIIKVDRPFLFFVRHEVTLAHLFWGLVVNPGREVRGGGG